MDQAATLIAAYISAGILGWQIAKVLDKQLDWSLAKILDKHTTSTRIGRATQQQPAQADPPAGPFDPEIEDLVEEINRLRAENAVLSGAYQFVLLEENGRRSMVRFTLN